MATDKRFSLSRMLVNADSQNSPEFETHYRLVKANEGWKNTYGIGSAGMRRGASEVSIPWGALAKKKKRLTRDLTTQTQSSGAFTVGTDVPVGIQKSLRPTSIIFKLPITVLENCQGSVVLPRISSGVTPSSGTEIQNLTPSVDPSFGAANGGPQRMTCQVVFSRQLLAQAALTAGGGIDQILTDELCRAISTQIDSQILVGSGVNGQALGILTNPGATSTNTYVAAGGWGQVMAAQKQIEDGFVDAKNACWLVSTNTAKVWRTTLRTGNSARYILDQSDRVNDVDAYATSFIPASSDQTILADWTQLVFCSFGQGIDLVYDPYTKAGSGEVVITANLFWQAFIRRPQTFVISTNAGSVFTS
jgi:HK97 family phage major capsid protein